MQQKVLFDNKISYIGSLKINKGETNIVLKDISYLVKPIKDDLKAKEAEHKIKLNDKFKYYFKIIKNKKKLIENNNVNSLNSFNSENLKLINSESYNFPNSKSLSIYNSSNSSKSKTFEPYILKVAKKILTEKDELNADVLLTEHDNINRNINTGDSLDINKGTNKDCTFINNSINSSDTKILETIILNENQANNVEILNSNSTNKNRDNKNEKNILINDFDEKQNYNKSNNNCNRLLELITNYSENILSNCKKTNSALKLPNNNENFYTNKRKFNYHISDLLNEIEKSKIRRFKPLTFLNVPGSQFKSEKCRSKSKLLENDTYIKDRNLNTCARVISYQGRFKNIKPSKWLQNRSTTSSAPYKRGFFYKYPRIEYQRMKSMKKFCIQIKPSVIHGMGLFANRNFDNGEMIIEYIGEIIRLTVANKREIKYEALKKGCYMFQLDDERIIDATHFGGIARYINHSCKPNCTTRVLSIGGKSKIVILAVLKICKGEELTYNYKFKEEDVKIVCRCRTNKCRGYLN